MFCAIIVLPSPCGATRTTFRAESRKWSPTDASTSGRSIFVVTVGDLKMTVVGPRKTELEALQEKWNTEIKPMLKKERSRARLAEIAAYVDKSVHNLSSIVVLVESQGKSLLLTGDGRGDRPRRGGVA